MVTIFLVTVLVLTLTYRRQHPSQHPAKVVVWVGRVLGDFLAYDLPTALVVLGGPVLFYGKTWTARTALVFVSAYAVFAVMAVLGYRWRRPVLTGSVAQVRDSLAFLEQRLTSPGGLTSSPPVSSSPAAGEHTAATAAERTRGRNGAVISWATELWTPRTRSVAARLERLRQSLDTAVIGQERGKHAVQDALARAWTGTRAGKGPITALIFTGPTGVGKTEMAEVLARALEWPLKFFPLGQAGGGQGSLAWKLFGPEPGYMGSQHGGELTQFLRANPESVIVFDEFEKPLQHDPTFFQSLLYLLSEGRVKDNSVGDTYDASHCIAIFTSNLLAQEPDLDQLDSAQLKTVFGARAGLPPEFLGRIKGVVPFRPLQPAEMEQIARKIVTAVLTTFIAHNTLVNVAVEIGPGVLPFLVERTDARYGVRDLHGVIEEQVGSALATAWVATGERVTARLELRLAEGRIVANCE